MSFSINLAIITGNVTRDRNYVTLLPVLLSVASALLPITPSKKMTNGQTCPLFTILFVWGKQAEYLSNTLKKGMKVSLQGRIDNRSYDAKDGTKKYISEIIAETVIPFTDRRTGSDSYPENGPASEPSISQSAPAEANKVEDIIIPDEMPF
jgi:single-strand DNA-binding protein